MPDCEGVAERDCDAVAVCEGELDGEHTVFAAITATEPYDSLAAHVMPPSRDSSGAHGVAKPAAGTCPSMPSKGSLHTTGVAPESTPQTSAQ